MSDTPHARSPLEIVAPLAVEEGFAEDGSRHIEFYTMEGLLTFLWAGDPAAQNLVVCMGGAMGGLLGPARGLFHELAATLPAEGIGVMRVGYRQPGDATRCLVDVAAAAESAAKVGARRFVFLGHSFGGAVAIQAGATMAGSTAGVATLATQSAGCESAGELGDTPFLLFHGASDRIMGPENSHMVQMIAGKGDVRVLAGADHLLNEAADEIRLELYRWLQHCFDPPDNH